MAIVTPEKWADISIHLCKREIEKWERGWLGDAGYNYDIDNEGDDNVSGDDMWEHVFGSWPTLNATSTRILMICYMLNENKLH